LKIPNELKVGSLTVIGIVTLILGFYYLKGVELFNKTKNIYVLLEDAAGIVAANPVAMHGKQIGKVQKVTFEEVGNYNVIFDLSVAREVEIPERSIVKIIELDLLGNKELRIIQPDEYDGFVEEYDTLYGEIKGNILASVENQISPIIEKTEPLLVNIDTLVSNINSMLQRNQDVIDAAMLSMERSIENFESITAQVDDMLAGQRKNIDGIMSNASELTGALAANTQKIDSILTNFTTISANISELELEPVVTAAEETLSEINKLMTALNEADGTLGKIIYEDGLYTELDSTMSAVNALITDLKANPKRYVSFSLIERKDKTKKE
jgi:phospholipid/cholesterol/gamma-HCH transport system substrate-binding protein